MHDIEHLPGIYTLGYIGENQFRAIEIDMHAWLAIIPNGVASIVHIRPGETQDNAYIAATSFHDGILKWQITNSDIGENVGYGIMQVSLVGTDESNHPIGKSDSVKTKVNATAMDISGDIPAAQQPWMDQMLELKAQAVEAAETVDSLTAEVRGIAEDMEATERIIQKMNHIYYSECEDLVLRPEVRQANVNGHWEELTVWGISIDKPEDFTARENDFLLVRFKKDIYARTPCCAYEIEIKDPPPEPGGLITVGDEECYDIPNMRYDYKEGMLLFEKDQIYAFRCRKLAGTSRLVYDIVNYNPWVYETDIISNSEIDSLFADYNVGGGV